MMNEEAESRVRTTCHARAEAIADELEQRQVRLLTTRAVLLEIGSALARLRFCNADVAFLDALEHDPAMGIVPLSESLFARAFQLFRARPDKEWGLTDCVSFVVMMDRGLTEALTTDEHFRQAGFCALLKRRDERCDLMPHPLQLRGLPKTGPEGTFTRHTLLPYDPAVLDKNCPAAIFFRMEGHYVRLLIKQALKPGLHKHEDCCCAYRRHKNLYV